MISLKRPIINQIVFFLLLAMVASFFFSVALNSILIGVFMLPFLIDIRNIKENIYRYLGETRNIFLLLILCSLLLSIVYSSDKNSAWMAIFAALPLASFPLSFSILPVSSLSSQKIQLLKRLYILVCLVATLILLVKAIMHTGLLDSSYKALAAPELQDDYIAYRLTYHQLSGGLHAVVLSLFITLAIFFIVFNSKNTSWRRRLLRSITIIYFLFFMLLLKSITINFALYSFLIVYFYFTFSFNKLYQYFTFFGTVITGAAVMGYLGILKYLDSEGKAVYLFDDTAINKKMLIFFLLLLFTALIAILIKLAFRKKYLNIILSVFIIVSFGLIIYSQNKDNEKQMNDTKDSNVTVRVKYGRAALQVIYAHPILGIGIGDKKNSVVMKSDPLPAGARPEHVFNSHNQFLDFWVAAGILPFIFFILFMINEFKKAWQRKNFVYLGLVYAFCLFCLTDSAMMIQRAQIFFLFFILIFENEYNRSTSTK